MQQRQRPRVKAGARADRVLRRVAHLRAPELAVASALLLTIRWDAPIPDVEPLQTDQMVVRMRVWIERAPQVTICTRLTMICNDIRISPATCTSVQMVCAPDINLL